MPWELAVTLKDERGNAVHTATMPFDDPKAAEEQLAQLERRGNLAAQTMAGDRQITIKNEKGEHLGFPLESYLSHKLRNRGNP